MSEAPAIGLPPDRVVDGQTYSAIGRTPHTTRDRREVELVVWRSQCATCGTDFEVPTGEAIERFTPSRHCSEHRARQIADQRRQRRAAAVRAAFQADPSLERSFGGWLPDYLLPSESL